MTTSKYKHKQNHMHYILLFKYICLKVNMTKLNINEEILIDLIAEQRFLWDDKDSNYSNRNMRSSAFDEIAIKIGGNSTGII